MADLVLALNAGSSTLKCALFEAGEGGLEPAARETLESRADPQGAMVSALAWAASAHAGELAAVGHRVVHGGPDFHAPTLVTPQVLEALDALTPLAPLHQPESLEGVRAMARLRPGLPQVACFDTAFHWSAPAVARRLGLPRELEARGMRRYGFHGLSYDYISGRLKTLDPVLAEGRVVAAHLGSGASLCAIRAGESVETTMGLSPLDGLLMSTRCGALDPGAVLYLLQHEQLSADEVSKMLYHRSGLLGVSGISGDMRTLLASPAPAAAEAVELFVHTAVKAVAALAAVLGGLDGLVFTAGVGENSPEVRARICERLAWLGLRLDEAANARDGEAQISSDDSAAKVWVVPTDEEQVIARQTLEVLGAR
jgi:acetate kinase